MARRIPRGNGPEAFARRLVSLSFLPRNAASLSSALILLSFASSVEASRGRLSPSSWFSESWDPLPVDINPNSNRERQVETNAGRTETTEYTYDFVNRLKTVTYPDRSVRYEYDQAGNRIQEVTTGAEASDETFHYDAINRLERITDNLGDEDLVYSYDANGNTTSKTKGGVTTNFFFDIRDQLGEVRQGGNVLGRYGYDYQGRRILKIGDDGRRQYTYDQLSVITEADQVNNTVSKYDYGMDQVVRLDNRNEGRSFFYLDILGSTVSLTGGAGTGRQSIFYDAWGNERDRTGSSANNFTFTGHELDEETGLIYAKSRFYDSEVGRFLNQDSFLGEANEPPSLHRYAYAVNRPTFYVDSTGHMPDSATIKFDYQAEQCSRNPAACTPATDFFDPRVQGGFRAGGGILTMLAGVAAAPDSFGASLVLIGVGWDQTLTGLAEVVTGEKQKPVAHIVVEETHLALGTTPETAERAGQAGEVLSLMAAGGAGLLAEGAAAPSVIAEIGESGRVSALPRTTTASVPTLMRPPSVSVPMESTPSAPKSGETSATRIGKQAHASVADERRTGTYGDFDLVNQPIPDAAGNPVLVPHRVDLRTGAPQPGTYLQEAVPDAVSFRRGLIIDDKPLGRSIMKDRQEIIRAIRAYEASQGMQPRTIAIPRYDPATGQFVRTDLYTPADFLPKPR